MLVTGDCGTSDHEALALARARGIDAIVIDHHQVPSGETRGVRAHQPAPARRSLSRSRGSPRAAWRSTSAAALRTRLRRRRRPLRSARSAGPGGARHGRRPGAARRREPHPGRRRPARSRRRASAPGCARSRRSPSIEPTEPITAARRRLPPGAAPQRRRPPRRGAAGAGSAAGPRRRDRRSPGRRARGPATASARRIQEQVWTEALARLRAARDRRRAVVVGAEGWHPGVVGIVAAKLVDKFARPAIVDRLRGGAGARLGAHRAGLQPLRRRSSRCAPHLVALRRPRRRRRHERRARQPRRPSGARSCREAGAAASARATRPPLRVDAVVELRELDLPVAEELARLGAVRRRQRRAALRAARRHRRVDAPRGAGAPAAHAATTAARLGDAIAFGMADRDPGQGAVRRLCSPRAELDTFRGARRARLKVQASLPAGARP